MLPLYAFLGAARRWVLIAAPDRASTRRRCAIILDGVARQALGFGLIDIIQFSSRIARRPSWPSSWARQRHVAGPCACRVPDAVGSAPGGVIARSLMLWTPHPRRVGLGVRRTRLPRR